MKKLTYEEFGYIIANALSDVYNGQGIRLGQAIFNHTFYNHPELANSLRATGADCFHQDSKIIHFVNAILES